MIIIDPDSIFGWSSFLLLKILPHKLGWAQPDEKVDYHVEIRQKYFYLLGIPFYPTQKWYVIRKKGDNSYYQTTPEQIATINQHFTTPKAPWYSYALPISITLLIISGIMSMGK